MEETMNGKFAYERFSHHHGVKIKHYRGDNMRYNEASFTNSCNETNQNFNYCGVGAHHQNGIAEAKIRHLHTVRELFSFMQKDGGLR